MSTFDPYIRVDELRALLADPRLLPNDRLCALTLAQTGNLTIIRGMSDVPAERSDAFDDGRPRQVGEYIGYVSINPAGGGASSVELLGEETDDEDNKVEQDPKGGAA